LLASEIRDANDRYAGILEIRRTTDGRGWGLYALRPFLPEQLAMTSRATASPNQTAHSVQIGWDRHVEIDLPARFVNHACNTANVGIRLHRRDTTPSYDFYALRGIQAGEELLWDYECSEYEISNFACRCGSATCRGELLGYRLHRSDVLQAYGKRFVAPYLLELQVTGDATVENHHRSQRCSAALPNPEHRDCDDCTNSAVSGL
jgi:hypothetical protein